MQADNVLQRVPAEKSPKPLFPFSFLHHFKKKKKCSCLLQSPNKTQTDQKNDIRWVSDYLQADYYLLKFARHCLPKEETHQNLPLQPGLDSRQASHPESIHPTSYSLQRMPLKENASNELRIPKSSPSILFKSYLTVQREYSSLYISLLGFFCYCIKFYLCGYPLASPRILKKRHLG